MTSPCSCPVACSARQPAGHLGADRGHLARRQPAAAPDLAGQVGVGQLQHEDHAPGQRPVHDVERVLAAQQVPVPHPAQRCRTRRPGPPGPPRTGSGRTPSMPGVARRPSRRRGWPRTPDRRRPRARNRSIRHSRSWNPGRSRSTGPLPGGGSVIGAAGSAVPRPRTECRAPRAGPGRPVRTSAGRRGRAGAAWSGSDHDVPVHPNWLAGTGVAPGRPTWCRGLRRYRTCVRISG